jgi:chromosomal replication initiator protein
MAILKAKGESQSVDLPIEVVEFIAQRFQTNIRELEGALNQVLGLSRMMGYPLTVATAERALYNMMRTPVELTIDQVLDIVAAYFGLRVDDLKGPRRTKKIAFARHIAMYLARDLTDMSLPRIGQSLGGRDHTTILYGYGKIAGLFEKDDSIRRQILEIKNRLYSGTQRLHMP